MSIRNRLKSPAYLWLLNCSRQEWGCFFCSRWSNWVSAFPLHIIARSVSLIAQESFVSIWNAIRFSCQPPRSKWLSDWWLTRHSLLWIIKITHWARNYSSWSSTEKKKGPWERGNGCLKSFSQLSRPVVLECLEILVLVTLLL